MKLPEELQFIVNARMTQKSTEARLDGRVCVTTGATSGVGYQSLIRLAQGGAHNVIICRNLEKASLVKKEIELTYGTRVDVIQADFSRLSEVRKAANVLLEKYPHINILINNIGVHYTHRTLTEDGIETVFATNHIASFLLTCLLLQRLKESAPARIIQVNSQGHRFGGLDLTDLNWEKRRYKGLQGYGASKVAQLLTVWELAEQLEGSKVTINAVHPGEVKTNIGMNNGLIYRLYQRFIIAGLLKDPIISGNAIYYLAAAPELAEVSGKFFNQTILEKPAIHALDRELGKKVWQVSESLAGF
ncbi:MAG: SDR family NAD(P)-dependent oxidoreductase [Anaerolineaceae bacterium]|nr:SDR family NAD(P)-dependent oxidoreductase [Anaerolineaceae bacterium]